VRDLLDLPASLIPVGEAVAAALEGVRRVFDDQLASDLPPVSALVAHVERYRGKMLRPTLVLLSGLATHPRAAAAGDDAAALAALLTGEHLTVGAVCEMVHMATLVHDDVLDGADVRRRGDTVNRLHGNEAAVILGDYLIAAAYHLCSTLEGGEAALRIGRASMVVCAGELLQLHHRDDFSLDEATYLEIVERKTAELIAASAELGAAASGATPAARAAMAEFGRRLGVAFQIQDDLLDLTGLESVVGKPVGKDAEKGKTTLPVIHHLARADPAQRGRTLLLLEAAASGDAGATPRLRRALDGTDSLGHARRAAERHVASAVGSIASLPDTPAKGLLLAMAEAVVDRRF